MPCFPSRGRYKLRPFRGNSVSVAMPSGCSSSLAAMLFYDCNMQPITPVPRVASSKFGMLSPPVICPPSSPSNESSALGSSVLTSSPLPSSFSFQPAQPLLKSCYGNGVLLANSREGSSADRSQHGVASNNKA